MPEVIGKIRERWEALGGPGSFLGNPITDEMEFSEGGRISVFERGQIYFWPDVGAIEIGEVIVHYTGLNCFGETDELSSADEPYVVLGVHVPDERARSFTTQVHGDVDAGDTRPEVIELYRGKPKGITIIAQMMEHDEGRPEDYRAAMEGVAAGAGAAVTAGLKFVPKIGPVLALAAGPILALLNPVIGERLGKLFGLGDDMIGHTTIVVTPRDMVLLAARPDLSVERNVGFKIQSVPLHGDGATYKVYFNILRVP